MGVLQGVDRTSPGVAHLRLIPEQRLAVQFYFIRHAQSQNNALYLASGSSAGRSPDPELTDLGSRQAGCLAEHLAHAFPGAAPQEWDPQNRSGYRLTHLYTSLMLRAAATAAILGAALGLRPVALEEVHEEGGIYREDPQSGQPLGLPGKGRSYYREHYPELVLPNWLGEDGWWRRPHETPDQVPQRARRFLDFLRERHAVGDDRVALVSHAGFYNYLLCALFDLPRSERLWFTLNNAALTRIDFYPEGASLVYHNRADYLPVELVT